MNSFKIKTMARKDSEHYAAKHPSEIKLNLQIAEAIKQKVPDGRIACAAAHKIARELNIPPAEVGVTIDLLEIHINKCQLGLYGYYPEKKIAKPAENVSSQLAEVIKKSLVNNCISCFSCWEIAKRLSITKMGVSSACEMLKAKISACQLGSF